MIPVTIHFANLSRGTLCAPPDSHYVRIQSTWCEQKRWGDILTHLGADFLTNLALGRRCVVHDQSERDRKTRAVWQGLPWIRFVCEMVWDFHYVTKPIMRNGQNVTNYFIDQWCELEPKVKTTLRYYRKFEPKQVLLEGCDGH